MSSVVFYHSNCFDGTMAAAGALWAYQNKRFAFDGDLTLVPINYSQSTWDEFSEGQYAPLLVAQEKSEGAITEIYFVDFCPKKETLINLVELGYSVVVLDHHKSAQEDLQGLEELLGDKGAGLTVSFDMERSGALMAWQYFADYVPDLVKHVADRDLWKFEMNLTPQVILWLNVNAAVNKPQTYVDACNRFNTQPAVIKGEGIALMKLQEKNVKDQGSKWRPVDLEGFPNGAIVMAGTNPSEVCQYVYENNAVAWVMGFSFTKQGRVAISLRSKDGAEHSIDVTKLARQWGGGGHKHASGCMMELEEFMAIYSQSRNQGT